jgi:hypothetical protein
MSISRTELRLVVDTYKFYYEKVAKVQNFVFKNSDSRMVVITNFILEFKEVNQTKLLQEVALKKYFDFQFNYWYKRDAKYGRGTSIQIEWIIGRQAIDRWKKVNKKYMSFIVRKNLKTDNDFTTKEVKIENWNNLLIEINPTEEFNKSKFLNKDIGFEACLLTTNLYNHKSPSCLSCNKSLDCKSRLKIIFPKIYKIRGYGK